MTEKTKNYFEELNEINVSDKIEKKNNLSYLSWAWAWGELKKRYPRAEKIVYKNQDGWLYHTDGKTCWVEVAVIIPMNDNPNADIKEIEYLPVMDFKNQAIPLERITSTAVNTTIQRAITKAIARHGLGLYIYAGEDLPESEEIVKPKKEPVKNAFGLSKDGDLASGADMTETLQKSNKAEAERVVEEIKSTKTMAGLLDVRTKNKSIVARLAKHDKPSFDLVAKAKLDKLFPLMKSDIEGCGSLAEVNGMIESWTNDLIDLEKADPKRYEMLSEAIDEIKLGFVGE